MKDGTTPPPDLVVTRKDHVMSGSLNRVTLIGNLGSDPESRSFQNGGKVVRFSLATNEAWTDKHTGERREKVEWHRVAVFNPGLANLADEYLRKGSKVLVEGQLRTSKFIDRDCVERYSTEVTLAGFDARLTFLDSKRNDEPATSGRTAPTTGAGDSGGEVPF